MKTAESLTYLAFCPSMINSLSNHFPYLFPLSHDTTENVHRYGEDDGAVVLCRDAVQGLEITKLKLKISDELYHN